MSERSDDVPAAGERGGALPVRREGPQDGARPFDVLVSYHSEDRAVAMEIAQALSARGVRPWIDVQELVPGQWWQGALEDALGKVGSTAVLVGASLGAWQRPEMRVAIDQSVRRGLRVIPVLVPGAPEEPELPLFLQGFTWVDMRCGLTEEALDRLQWGVTGVTGGGGKGEVEAPWPRRTLAAAMSSELHQQREAARERYVAFVQAAVTAEDNINEIRSLGNSLYKMRDLFGEPMVRYLGVLLERAQELRAIRDRKRAVIARGGASQEEVLRLAGKENELVPWFTAQYGELLTRMAPFFDRVNEEPAPGTVGERADRNKVDRPRVSVRVCLDREMAVLIVQNLGDSVELECKLACIHGLADWPSETVYALWENGKRHKSLGRGETARIVVAKLERSEKAGRIKGYWKILGDGLELKSEEFVTGYLIDVQHDLLGPFLVSATLVSDNPPFVLQRGFQFRGTLMEPLRL